MKMMIDISTTIRLKRSTQNRLKKFGSMNESYDELVNRLVSACEVYGIVRKEE